MPQTVHTPHGDINFPDNFTPDMIEQGVKEAIPQMQAVPAQFGTSQYDQTHRLSNLAGAGGEFLDSIGRGLETGGARVMNDIATFGGLSPRQAPVQFGVDLSVKSAPYFQPGKLIVGLSQLNQGPKQYDAQGQEIPTDAQKIVGGLLTPGNVLATAATMGGNGLLNMLGKVLFSLQGAKGVVESIQTLTNPESSPEQRHDAGLGLFTSLPMVAAPAMHMPETKAQGLARVLDKQEAQGRTQADTPPKLRIKGVTLSPWQETIQNLQNQNENLKLKLGQDTTGGRVGQEQIQGLPEQSGVLGDTEKQKVGTGVVGAPTKSGAERKIFGGDVEQGKPSSPNLPGAGDTISSPSRSLAPGGVSDFEVYSKLVQEFKDAKDVMQKFQIQGAIEQVKNRNGGMPPKPEVKDIEQLSPGKFPHEPVLNAWRNVTKGAPEVEVHNDATKVQGDYGVQGWVEGGKVHVNLAHIDSPNDMARVLREEHNHLLLDTEEGKGVIQDALAKNLGVEERAALQERYGKLTNEQGMNEFIAQAGSEEKTGWRRVVEQVKEWLAEKGLVTLNDREVAKAMLKTLKGKLGGGGEVGEGKGEKSLNSESEKQRKFAEYRKLVSFKGLLDADLNERVRKGVELFKQAGLKLGDKLYSEKGTEFTISSEGISVDKKGEPTVIATYTDNDGQLATSSVYLNKLTYDNPKGGTPYSLTSNPVTFTKETAERVKNHWLTGPIRDAVTYAKDASDNSAMVSARREANTVKNDLGRVFKGETGQAAKALTFVVEAQGDVKQLDVMRGKIATSTKGSAAIREEAIKSIDFAKKNWTQLQAHASKYQNIMDAQLKAENSSGFDTPYRKGYVFHAQDIDTSLGFFRGSSGETPTSFKKMREHPTYADSISAGVKPKSLNAAGLLETRLSQGMKMVNNKAWVDSFRGVKDTVTGLPLVENLEFKKRPNGSQYIDVPKGYSQEYLGGQTVAVHNGYEGLFSALSDPSWFDKSPVRRGVQEYNAFGKSVSLVMDTFHLARIAYWESMIKSLGITTFKAPIPSYKKGLSLLDHTTPELQKMLSNRELPQAWGKDLLQNKKDIDLLVQHGYNIGRVTDALHHEWKEHIPIVGEGLMVYDKFLFDSFQRGAMTEVGLLELKRYRGMYKDLSDTEITRRVAKDLNTRFGNIGRQGWFKSKTAQDIARLVALAPQWNEGLIKSEAGAVRQGMESAYDAATGKRIAAGVLLRSVAGMVLAQFAANQIINYYTRGQPTWKNKEEGLGAKLSAWIPDLEDKNGKGFFLHPMGLGAEITHLLLKRYESTADMRKTVMDFLRSRSSQVMKPILDFALNEDQMGRKLKPGTVWAEMMGDGVPKPIPYQAAKAGLKGQEEFPGQLQKQVMSSVGIKTDQVPSAASRIGKLAREFNTKHGIQPKGEFYGSDYAPLIQALHAGNQDVAKKEYTKLIETHEPDKVYEYFVKYPNHLFTGQTQREMEFKKTLNEEQLQAYGESKKEREDVRKKFYELMRQPRKDRFHGFEEGK